LEALQIYLFISVFSIRASSTNINRIATLRHWRLNLFFSTLTNWRTCTPIQISSIYYKKKDGTKVVMFHNTTCQVRRFKRCCCAANKDESLKSSAIPASCIACFIDHCQLLAAIPIHRISDSFFLIQQLKVEKDICLGSHATCTPTNEHTSNIGDFYNSHEQNLTHQYSDNSHGASLTLATPKIAATGITYIIMSIATVTYKY
jgi:hypothetical protein